MLETMRSDNGFSFAASDSVRGGAEQIPNVDWLGKYTECMRISRNSLRISRREYDGSTVRLVQIRSHNRAGRPIAEINVKVGDIGCRTKSLSIGSIADRPHDVITRRRRSVGTCGSGPLK